MAWKNWAKPGYIVKFPMGWDFELAEVFLVEAEMVHLTTRDGRYYHMDTSFVQRHWPLTEREEQTWNWKIEQYSVKEKFKSLLRRLAVSRSKLTCEEKMREELLEQCKSVFGDGVEISYSKGTSTNTMMDLESLPPDPYDLLPKPPI